MKELCSFKDVIENRFYSKIEAAVSEYIQDNVDSLDVRSYHIEEADEAELADITVNRVDVYDAAGDGIRFDVIVETEITISSRYHSDVETDDVSQWFRISCSGELNAGLQNFSIGSVSIYSPGGRTGDRMTDNLVPVIAKEQFDNEAEAFLIKYYPEALREPIAVDVHEVVQRMGLTVKQERLSRHFTIFGEMVFGDCEIEIYDAVNRIHVPISVERGTILVDPDVYFMRCLGCWNNTVIHECIHWDKHKKYHELAAMYDADANRISCQVHERERQRRNQKPEDWMEWQANGIAPRILMPKSTAIQKIEELIRRHESVIGTENRLAVMEGVLFELADFFGVSRVAAKIRMLDLGYMDVEGVATFVDDHYISSYAFAADSKSRDQTFSISLSDSFFEYFANEKFRDLIDTGNFTYVDGHYVIDDPKYVERNSLGGLDLTEYAKHHVDECCLRFDLVYNKAAENDVVVYLDKIEYRKATPDYSRVPSFKADDHNMEVFNRSAELRKFHEEYSEELSVMSRPTLNYAQTVWAHIERLGLSRKDFCEKTLLSEKSYDRIRNNSDRRPTLETVMRICIGLELGGILGEQLLELAGYKLNAYELAYKKLLHSYKGHDIYECDEVLRALGLPSILPKQYRMAE